MKTLETYKEKEQVLFDFINIFNEEQCKHFYKDYSNMKAKEKRAYIDSAINDGIYIHLENLAESTPVFYRCIHALEKFPFIKEDDLYIRKWNREYKCLTKSFIGEMYILKQIWGYKTLLIAGKLLANQQSRDRFNDYRTIINLVEYVKEVKGT